MATNNVTIAAGDWVFQRGDEIQSDVLFVFGTPHHVPDFAHRIHELWLSQDLQHVIISGRGGEAEALATAAHRLGVPPDIFRLERNASNTRDNVAFSEDLLRTHCPHGRLHVLAKLYAAPRGLLTLRHWFPEWRLGLHVVDWFGVTPSNWLSDEAFRRKVSQEMRKVANYAQRGDIALPPSPWTPNALSQVARSLEDQATDPAVTLVEVGPEQALHVQVSETDSQEIGDMHLVTLEAHIGDAAGESVLRTTVVKRSDAVGVIAYDDRLDEVILVEQFRAGPHVTAGLSTMLEVVAGYMDSGECARESAQRELQEETGLIADRMVHIATYFPAPTLSSERMSLWCGLVDSRAARTHSANGAERIRVVRLTGAQAIALVFQDEVTNALTLTALQWLIQARPVLLATHSEGSS